MLKDFIKDSLVYGAGAVFTRSVSLLLVPLLTRTLAPNDYGATDILTLVGSLVALSVALEISQAVPRFFADADTEEARVAYASSALWFTVAVYTLVCTAAILGSRSIVSLLLTPGYVSLFQSAVVWYAATGIFYLVQGQLRWERRAAEYAIASVLAASVSLAAVAMLLLHLHLGAPAVFVGQAAGNAVGATVALYFARRSFGPVFNWERCKEMLRFSAPLVPSGLAVFVALYSDRVIVQRLMSLADVGKLAVGYRVASVVGLIMVGFQSALMPLVFAKYREPDTPVNMARIFGVFSAFALLLCTTLGLFSREIVMVLTNPRYYTAANVVPLLAPAVLLSSMYIFAPGLVIAKRTASIAVLNFAGAALNVVLNLLLVPVLGIVGAATATLVSAALTFALYMISSQRHYPVPHQWSRLSTALLASVLGSIAGFLLGEPSVGVLALKVLMLATVALIIFKLQLVKTAEVAAALAIVTRRRATAGADAL